MPLTISIPPTEHRKWGFGASTSGIKLTIPIGKKGPYEYPEARTSRKTSFNLGFGRTGKSRKTIGVLVPVPKKQPDMPKRLSLRAALAKAGVRRMTSSRSYSGIRKKYKRSRSAPPRRRTAKRPLRTKRALVVGRNFPPEQLKVTLKTETFFTLLEQANTIVPFAMFKLGNKLNCSDMVVWAGGLATGAANVRSAATPRQWSQWTSIYDKYRIIKIVHHVTLTGGKQTDQFDYDVMHFKQSTDHIDVPVPITAIGDIGVADPYDAVDDASLRIRNYRYTKVKRLFRHTGQSSRACKYSVTAAIHRDLFGQKTMGGKYNDDASGFGFSVQKLVTDINTQIGCNPVDIFIVEQHDRTHTATWEPVEVRVNTVFTVEFIDRKDVVNLQTGGYF